MHSVLLNPKLSIAKLGAVAALVGVGMLMFTAVAFAGVGVSVAPNFPSTVTVGDSNVAVSLAITNNSTSGDGNPLTLNSIKLIPSCGALSGSTCTTPDTGVFNVDAAGTGAGSCTGINFTIAETNGTTGEVTFTPSAPIALSPTQTCTINFTVDVIGSPDTDATGAAGVQTLQLGTVAGTDQLQQPGTGTGSDTTTVVAQGHIIVDKVTNPSGDTQSFAFTTSGSGYSGFSLTDAAAPNDQTLNAGNYTVNETPVAGWTMTGATCATNGTGTTTYTPGATLALGAGDTIRCTFNNQKDTGRIIIVKSTNVATTTQFEFDSSWGPNFMLGNGQSTTTGSTTPGTYSIGEINLPANWSLGSSSCSDGSPIGAISLQNGETVTCTFNNVYTPPPPPASEWCSPGYWKNHPEEAIEAATAGGFSMSDTYASHFGSAPALSKKGQKDGASSNPTLLQVVNNPQYYGGPATNNVADLLSDAHPDVDYTGTRVENCPLN